MVKFLGRGRNKKKVFLAKTCISVIILLMNVAKRNSVKWVASDSDKPSYVGSRRDWS